MVNVSRSHWTGEQRSGAINQLLATILLAATMSGCATDQKKDVRAFADSLRVGMPVAAVEESAKNYKGIYLMDGQIGIESVRHYCQEQYCVPKNLLELLHPAADQGRAPQDVTVAEPSLDFKHYGLGEIKQRLVVFYDAKSRRVIGWLCGGTDPVQCTPK